MNDAADNAIKIANERAPCDDCTLFYHCAAEGVGCQAFDRYANAKKWRRAPRIACPAWLTATNSDDASLKAELRREDAKLLMETEL